MKNYTYEQAVRAFETITEYIESGDPNGMVFIADPRFDDILRALEENIERFQEYINILTPADRYGPVSMIIDAMHSTQSQARQALSRQTVPEEIKQAINANYSVVERGYGFETPRDILAGVEDGLAVRAGVLYLLKGGTPPSGMDAAMKRQIATVVATVGGPGVDPEIAHALASSKFGRIGALDTDMPMSDIEESQRYKMAMQILEQIPESRNTAHVVPAATAAAEIKLT